MVKQVRFWAGGDIEWKATDNEPINVDVIGDMPSTCTSPYFISTTNLDKNGKKKKKYSERALEPNILLWLHWGKKFIRSQNNSYVKHLNIGGKPYGSWQ